MSNEWFWEGNVVKAIDVYLRQHGWLIEKIADTERRETGVDVIARKGERVLLVEIKGYPSTIYQRGVKQGQPKSTNPSTQARHWYSEVLLTAILRQSENPTATVAIACPDFSVYRNLINKTQHALTKLSIVVCLVKESGEVEVITPEAESG